MGFKKNSSFHAYRLFDLLMHPKLKFDSPFVSMLGPTDNSVLYMLVLLRELLPAMPRAQTKVVGGGGGFFYCWGVNCFYFDNDDAVSFLFWSPVGSGFATVKTFVFSDRLRDHPETAHTGLERYGVDR